MKREKIAILTPTFSYFSGPDRVVERQANDLISKGHDVMLFALDAEMPPPTRVRLVVMGMPRSSAIQRVYRLLLFFDIPKIVRYSRMLNGFDRMICHMYPMTIFACVAKKIYGIHYTYYNMGIAYPRLFRNAMERTYMRLFLAFTKLTVRCADTAISISAFLRDELQSETGIHGDIELCKIHERFKPGVDARAIKEKYLLTFPTLLYVGRISPHKGIHLLIIAFKHVLDVYPCAKLLIVGKHTFSQYSRELEKLKNNDSRIIFVGFVADEDLPAYFAACDMYTSATLWEGFNLPAAEAQACGKPVVLFKIGAHPEIVKDGILVEEGNVKLFAHAVIELLKKKT